MIVSKFHKMPRLQNEADDGDDGGSSTTNITDGDGGSAVPAGGAKGPAADGGTDHADATNNGDEDRGDSWDPAKAQPVALSPAPGPAAAPAPTAAPAPAAAPAGAPAADTGLDANGNRIPQARFNEVVAQRQAAEERARAAEEELARLRAGAAPAPTPAPAAAPAPTAAPAPAFDVRAQEEAYAELLADGEFKKAADLRMQINQHIQQEATLQAEANIAQRAAHATVQSVADAAVAAYPALDTEEGGPAMAAILAERQRLERTGQPAHVALQAAVDKFAPLFFPGAAAPVPPGKGSTATTPAVDTRPAAAARRGAAAAEATPPSMAGAGQGNEPLGGIDNTADLTEAQFEALSEEEKKRRRGDY